MMSGCLGERLEELAGEVGHRSGAGRAVGELARIGLVVVDELLDRVHRDARVDDDGERRHRDHRDRLEILHRIVERLDHSDRIEDQRTGAAEQDRVAVGRSMRDGHRADRAAGAALVLDIDGAAERRLDVLGPQPRHRIIDAARRKGNDELDGAVGILRLRCTEPRCERAAGERREASQYVTTLHRTAPGFDNGGSKMAGKKRRRMR